MTFLSWKNIAAKKKGGPPLCNKSKFKSFIVITI